MEEANRQPQELAHQVLQRWVPGGAGSNRPRPSAPPAGLGTSTSKEAKEYFSEMEKHRISFRYSGAEDDAAITLVSGPPAPPPP